MGMSLQFYKPLAPSQVGRQLHVHKLLKNPSLFKNVNISRHILSQLAVFQDSIDLIARAVLPNLFQLAIHFY